MKKWMLRGVALTLCLLMMAGMAWAEEWDDHLLMNYKDGGTCHALTGETEMLVVFVDVPDAAWSDEEIQARKKTIEDTAAALSEEAAEFGVQLHFTTRYSVSAADTTIRLDNDAGWTDAALEEAGLPVFAVEDGEPSPYKDTPVIFCLNTGGRAFAQIGGSDTDAEYIILYADDGSETIRHEMMHLYGARDYYETDAFASAAEAYCPTSVMLASGDETVIDSLTAYIIGWSEELDDAAISFLQATEHVTREDMTAAAESGRITGYTVEKGDGYVYAGMMVDGVRHGQGVMRWENGDVYIGEWEWGARTGKGSFTWPDGTTYTGEFVDGKCTGTGIIEFDTGDIYVGDVIDLECTGEGVVLWVSGASYSGGFANSLLHGKGSYTWPSGANYTGDFVNDKRTGKGTYTWADGDVYVGDFVNGERTGKGTRTWVSGATYTGDFVNGDRTGKGTYTWPSGAIYTGDFVDNKRTGKGSYTWPDGTIYTGDFVDGNRTGKGTMTWADGSTYTGDFVDGELHGVGTYTNAEGEVQTGRWENGTWLGE